MTELLFATNNSGKLAELRGLASGYNIDILSLDDADISSNPEETGTTFMENATLKLDDVLSRAGGELWVAADDAGMMIDYLGGEPGVHTRRWDGTEMSDQGIIDYALEQLNNATGEQRAAKFVVQTLLAHTTQPAQKHPFRGELHGRILEQESDELKPVEGLPLRQIFQLENGHMLGDPANPTGASARVIAFTDLLKFIVEHDRN